jgi:predicted RNase H-like HicB family nuclease
MAYQARIPVRIYFDNEVRTWHFHVPALEIVGGGQPTHDEARQAAAEAIAFALEFAPAAEPGETYEELDVAVG